MTKVALLIAEKEVPDINSREIENPVILLPRPQPRFTAPVPDMGRQCVPTPAPVLDGPERDGKALTMGSQGPRQGAGQQEQQGHAAQAPGQPARGLPGPPHCDCWGAPAPGLPRTAPTVPGSRSRRHLARQWWPAGVLREGFRRWLLGGGSSRGGASSLLPQPRLPLHGDIWGGKSRLWGWDEGRRGPRRAGWELRSRQAAPLVFP